MDNHHSITLYSVAPPLCQVKEQTKRVTFKSQPTTPKQTKKPQQPAKSRQVRMLENQKARKLKENIDRNECTVANGTSMLMALRKVLNVMDKDRHDETLAPPVTPPDFQKQYLAMHALPMSAQWFMAANNTPT